MDNMMDKKEVESLLKDLVKCYIDFPHSQVCKHWVALQVLNGMEELGFKVDEDLVDSVVRADDYKTLAILNTGDHFR